MTEEIGALLRLHSLVRVDRWSSNGLVQMSGVKML